MTQPEDDFEELSGGPDRPSAMPGWVRVGGGALLVVGVGWALVSGPGAGSGEPTRSGTPSSDAPSIAEDPDPLAELPQVTLTSTCVRTDHRRLLTVTFALENDGAQPVFIHRANPVLPLAGLLPTDEIVGKGECGGVSALGIGGLGTGQTRTLAMSFRLPRECPAPYPVQADVLVSGSAEGPTYWQRVPLLPDLGDFTFRQCRTPTLPG